MDSQSNGQKKTSKNINNRAVENRRTYRTIGQKLTRSDLNFFASDPMSGTIFQQLGTDKMLEDDRHHYLISLLKLVVVCNLRFFLNFRLYNQILTSH